MVSDGSLGDKIYSEVIESCTLIFPQTEAVAVKCRMYSSFDLINKDNGNEYISFSAVKPLVVINVEHQKPSEAMGVCANRTKVMSKGKIYNNAC